VTFDLETVLLDTLRSSPRVQSVSHRTSVALEQIVQQDAAFDSNVLFESRAGRTNDPVGNSLTTGGPPRLIERSLTARGGIQRTGRRGTLLDFSQEVGALTSNSTFFDPTNQGNARLGISLTQPLFSRSGRVYNERLLTQARIDSRASWQEMRGDVEQRIADVVASYWKLYELRCHLLQQTQLLQRAQRIEAIVEARRDFDAARIELAKARQRVARRADRKLQIEAEIEKQQTRLASLIGSDQLAGAENALEMIPLESPEFPNIELNLRDAVLQGVENRPEVRAAAADLESAALSIQVTRAELTPQWTAVVDSYLAGLNGDYGAFNSVTDQFTRGGPGLSGGIRYDMPYGRRAARSRHREANHRYRQRSEDLREAIQLTRAEIETELINVKTAMAQQKTKHRLLVTAIDEESVLARRWELMAGDGATVGTVLENLLDAQQRRTDAEREWTSAQTQYLTSLVDLQQAMGTLLIGAGIQPVQSRGSTTITFSHPAEAIQPGPSQMSPQPPAQHPRAVNSEGALKR
jgi:outer membrane protein TolC